MLLPQVARNFRTVMMIFSILSKGDALTIFLATRDGLESKRDMHKQLCITKKQYYTRLKQLVGLGLIEKQYKYKKFPFHHTSVYVPMLLGSMVYKRCLLGLEDMAKNSKKLEAVTVLNQSSKFSADKIMEILFEGKSK